MRIALLGSAYPFRGGLSAYNERLAQALQAQGHPVRLYTFTVQYPAWLFPGKTQYRDSPPPPGLDIVRSLHSLGPLSWWHTARRIQRFSPEVVIAKFWLPVMGVSLGSVLRLLRWFHPRTLRLTILDNVIPHETRIGDRLFTRYFIGSVDAAIAMSAAVETDWKKLSAKPVRRLFHPLYDSYGEPVERTKACQALGIDPAYRYLLFFGLIRPYKGLDLLLEAWESLPAQAYPQVRLLIAGELYEPRSKYEPLLQRLGERVLFHEGFIPDEKVRYYFSAADAIIQPYQSATQSGITQIAYHFERPMIVTNVGGLPEMVLHGETGLVCQPTRESLAHAIVQFLEGDATAWIPRVRQHKERFGWPAFAQALVDFVRSLQK